MTAHPIPIRRHRRAARRGLAAACCALICAPMLAGCGTAGYYAQAVEGHFALLAKARPIDELIDAAGTPAALKQRLQKARAIRRFATQALDLPDNASYTRYADLGRPAAVWSVFAARELSLELKTWCYPLFGCAGYRGYFDRARAERLAESLRAEGFDVNVAPVPAYSTLGWFADPLLNTFIGSTDGELARLIFHELAHQVVYVKDDTAFNESFATTVERAGVARWLASLNDAKSAADYAVFAARRARFQALLAEYRARLLALYADAGTDALTDENKRARKRELFDRMQADYRRVRDVEWNGFRGYDGFFARPLNNAHLAAFAVYTQWVPAFEALLARSGDGGGDMTAFYDEVRRLGRLDKARRDARLRELAADAARSAAAARGS